LFGEGDKRYGDTRTVGNFTGGGFAGNTQTSWNRDVGMFSGASADGIDVGAISATNSAAFKGLVGGVNSVYASLIASSGEAAKSLDGWSYAINQVIANEADLVKVTTGMSDSMGAYLIPQLTAFKREGETLADTAVRMNNVFIATDAVLGLVGGTFDSEFKIVMGGFKSFGNTFEGFSMSIKNTGLATMAARDHLVSLMGGLDQLSAKMQSYYSHYYTSSEQQAYAMSVLDTQFAALGVTTPATAAEFRALIEAQDLSTASGREMFASLMGLNAAFAAVVPSADAAAQAMAQAAATQLADAQAAAAKIAAIATQQRSLDIQLMEATGNASGALSAKRADELAALDASLRPTMKLIYAAQDKAVADAAAAQAAQDAARVAQDAAQAQAQAAQDAAQAAAQAQQAADQIKSAWQSVTDAIFSEVARIRGLMGATTIGNAQSAFAIATAQARAGDQNAAKLLPGLSQAVLDIEQATAINSRDLARARAGVASSLEQTGAMLTSQYGLQLPSYAVGTSSVPYDMVAQIHKGERITPAADNDGLLAEMRALRQEVAGLRASSDKTADATSKTTNILRNVTLDGNSLQTTPA